MTDSIATSDAPEQLTDAQPGDLMSKFDGLIAERQALIDTGPTEEAMDDYIAGYTVLAQQPVVLH